MNQRRRVLRRRHQVGRAFTLLAVAIMAGTIWANWPTTQRDNTQVAASAPAADGPVLGVDLPNPTSIEGTRAVASYLQAAGEPVTAEGNTVVIVGETQLEPQVFADAYVACVEQLIQRGDLASDLDEPALRIEAELRRIRAGAALEAKIRTRDEQKPETVVQPPRFIIEDSTSLEVATIVDQNAVVVTIVFSAAADPNAIIALNIVPGQVADPVGEQIDIRGKQGWFTEFPDGSISIVWQEHEQLALELAVSSTNDTPVSLDPRDLIGIATSIQEVTESDWQQYRLEHSP